MKYKKYKMPNLLTDDIQFTLYSKLICNHCWFDIQISHLNCSQLYLDLGSFALVTYIFQNERISYTIFFNRSQPFKIEYERNIES